MGSSRRVVMVLVQVRLMVKVFSERVRGELWAVVGQGRCWLRLHYCLFLLKIAESVVAFVSLFV
jgi:hypothetical protein